MYIYGEVYDNTAIRQCAAKRQWYIAQWHVANMFYTTSAPKLTHRRRSWYMRLLYWRHILLDMRN
jgi:hypothetical protein